MQTYTDIVNFVTALARVNSSELTALLPYLINEAYQRQMNRNPSGWPILRCTGSITTAADTQDYILPVTFARLIDESVRYYDTLDTTGPYRILPIVTDPDASIWESFGQTIQPQAIRVIPGADGTRRKLRLLPSFTEYDRAVSFAYYKKPNQTLTSTTTLDVPEIASAVAWDVLASNKDYFRDTNTRGGLSYTERAEQAYKTALRTTLQ